MATRTAVILCGLTPSIAQGVSKALLPEYEVIHIITVVAEGAAEIPVILSGKTPPRTESENLGSRDYSKKVAAVIMGRGYDDAMIEIMRRPCEGISNVPWLRTDLSIETPPLSDRMAYGNHMTGRVKACLKGLAEKGAMEKDGVVFY